MNQAAAFGTRTNRVVDWVVLTAPPLLRSILRPSLPRLLPADVILIRTCRLFLAVAGIPRTAEYSFEKQTLRHHPPNDQPLPCTAVDDHRPLRLLAIAHLPHQTPTGHRSYFDSASFAPLHHNRVSYGLPGAPHPNPRTDAAPAACFALAFFGRKKNTKISS